MLEYYLKGIPVPPLYIHVTSLAIGFTLVSFVHVVIEHDDVDNPDSLQDVPAFQAFVADIADRCDIPPLAMGATVVGGWR